MDFESQKNKEAPAEKANISEKRYEAMTTALHLMLQEVYSFEIPEQTVENWRKLGSIMYHIDDLIDTVSPRERSSIFAALNRSLENPGHREEGSGGIAEELDLLETIRQSLSPERQTYFTRVIRMILNVTESIKSETNIKKVVKLTMLEGQITSKLFIALLPSEFQDEERYREMCNLLSRMGRIGNAFDTAVDLKEDFANEQVKVTPTPLHRAAFLGAALSEGMRMKKAGTLTPKMVRLFLRSAREVISDKAS